MNVKKLYFLRTAFPQLFEHEFYEGKTIYIHERTMELVKKEMIGKNLDFFNPIILEFGVNIDKGDWFANIDKGTVHKCTYPISIKPLPRDKSPNCLFKILTRTEEFSDQQINDILSGKMKHKDIINE